MNMPDNTYTRLQEETQSKKIIAFGSGRFFREFMLKYPFLSEKIEFIMDNDHDKNTYDDNDITIPIVRPEEVKGIDCSKYIFIFCAVQWKVMKEQLDGITGQNYTYFHYPLDMDYRKNRELGIYHRIIVPTMEKLREYSTVGKAMELTSVKSEDELIKGLEQKKFYTVPRLTVVLTPRCSLRCKECNNLMWMFSGSRDLAAGKIIASLENIISQFDFIPCIELIGGEPFTAQNLKDVLDFLSGQEKVLCIEITTNATIIPHKEIINQLKNPKVIIHISDYGNVVNSQKFLECMRQNEIRFRILEFQGRWVSTGGTEKRNRSVEDLTRQYYQCVSGNLCKTLWEDRIYPCARAASLAALEIMTDCPSINSIEKEGLRERMYSFYIVPSCGACDYCDVSIENPVYVEPAVQLER